MRTECSRNCWIAGGVAGLLVWLSVGMVGSDGWLAGLLLGLLTAWVLGGILVWGLCRGAGNRADNEALLAGGWRDEPFTPTRRVVSPGGEVVSQEPLAMAGRIPGGAPLDSRTLTPGRDGGAAGAEGAARPRIVAGASPDAPVRPRPAGAATDAVPVTSVGTLPQPASDPRADDPALIQPAPAEVQVAHPTVTPVEGIRPQPPERPDSEGEALALDSTGLAAPATDAEAGDQHRRPGGGIEPLASGHADTRAPAKGTSAGKPQAAADATDADADDLTRIRGVGPMLSTWLAGYGVTRFAQIAAWDDADIARFAGMMGRMGHRIRGEDWVGQARMLAAGGETAHSHASDSGEAL